MSETAIIIGEVIVGLAFLTVVGGLVSVGVTRLLAKPPTALEILDVRYARGELTREQYQQMRADVGVGPAETRVEARRAA